MDTYFYRVPFNCFKYPGFAAKRYSTAAKATAFFDSSFNHIRQTSQLQTLETVAAQAKRQANPHPANAAATLYLPADPAEDSGKRASRSSQQRPRLVMAEQPKRAQYRRQPQVPLSAVNTILASRLTQRAIHTDIQDKLERLPVQEPTPEPSDKFFTPEEIEPVELSDATFAHQLNLEIMEAHNSGQFEKINSLYMALKRNGIIPSRDVYSIVLSSIAHRSIDDTVDDKLSTMLNVYQDLITNKMKPDLDIYSTVIFQLLDKAILAAVVPGVSTNGGDFFKIAIDIFNASNCSHIQDFNATITDRILVGMNLYPGLVSNTQLIKILQQQPNFEKQAVYYTALINYCKFTNDSELAMSLYEEFKTTSSASTALKEDQFVIYSAFISTLVSTNEISLATKFLDKLLTSIKDYDQYEDKATMLLSSYLLPLSQTNLAKTLEIWAQFSRIDWIPEFSYDFYSQLLDQSMRGTMYNTSLKLYTYMSALPQPQPATAYDPKTLLTTAGRAPGVTSRFLLCALQQGDKTTVLKMLRESFVRKTNFDYSVYPLLFQFLQSEDLIVRVVNTHGLSVSNGFDFLDQLTTSVANLPLYDIAGTEFFKRLVAEYTIYQKSIGLLHVWKSVFDVDRPTPELLEHCAALIVEFYDVNNHYAELPPQVNEFKLALTNYFTTHAQGVNHSELMEKACAYLHEMKPMN